MTLGQIIIEREAFRDRLRQFAVRAQREVCVRLGDFAPATDQEHRQAAEGAVAPHKLDCCGPRYLEFHPRAESA